ncbi:uncharacterized protein [Triticum aestivum]|uniref:uncharacterized protein n=1 Tax=Triticum aestivum TaxID=4565 RepID=UPI001D02D77C|nr:uncharacterized protein LOC123133689 [Triticum aestivum]
MTKSVNLLPLVCIKELWRQLGRRAAAVWAEELHRRGRSSSSMGRGAPPAGARARKKEQHGLAREIEEDKLEIEEEARELLVHRIVEAVSGEARRGSRPGGIAAAHARRIAARRNCGGARAELKEDARELEEDARELEKDVSGGSGDARW